MEGSPVYVIKQVNEEGDEFKHHIDAENYVTLTTTAKLNIEGSIIEVETIYGNYKPVKDIIMPFSIESKINGQTQSHIIIEEYIFDDPIDDAVFEMPPPAPNPEAEEE